MGRVKCAESQVLCREVKDLREVLLTNVVGTYLVTKAMLPSIRKGRKKQVGTALGHELRLNISSLE